MYDQIYNTSNEVVKSLKADKNYSFLVKNWNSKRGTKRRLTFEKIIALNLLRFFLHVKDLKSFPIISLFMQILFVRTVLYPDALRRGC